MNAKQQVETSAFHSAESASWKNINKVDATVIIPTYRRSSMLYRTLTALEAQKNAAYSFEVVVVDDGSHDSTAEVLHRFSQQTALAVKYLCLPENRGPAAARNRALELARGRLIIIIGDDIEPGPDLLERHIRWHAQHPHETQALLGYVTWPTGMKSNPFMRWLEKGGSAFYFGYRKMKNGDEIDPARYFYTCNVSLKRSMLSKAGLFDESFPYASHEDLELGYRLRKAGMRLYFNRSVKACHWHYLTVRSIAGRVYLMGFCANMYWRKVPEDTRFPLRNVRKIIAAICKLPPARDLLLSAIAHVDGDKDGRHVFSWRIILILSYWIGMADSMRNRPGAGRTHPGPPPKMEDYIETKAP